jgi:hypothetical protein
LESAHLYFRSLRSLAANFVFQISNLFSFQSNGSTYGERRR